MSIFDILTELGVPFAETRPGWYSTDCPWCGVPGKPGLGIPANTHHVATCFKCGFHSLADALAAITGRPWQQIKEMLGHGEEATRGEKTPLGKLRLPDSLATLERAHNKYLKDRGFCPDLLVSLWDVQGIAVAARLSWRVFIPIHFWGKTASWTTRAIGEAQPKYVSAGPDEEAVPHKSLLFGADHCRHAAIVVEGPFDAMRVGPGAVATFGASVTKAQLLRISRFPVRIVCLDADAQEQARRLCNELACFPGKTIRVELDAKDPAEAKPRDIKHLRRLLK